MKLSIAALIGVSSLAVVGVVFNAHARQTSSLTGTVQRVWEDGFRLDTGDRAIRVDSWDIYGDATASHVMVGDQVTVNGNFDILDFDASSIIDSGSDTSQVTPNPSTPDTPTVAQASGTSFSGVVERVWEDGLRLNAGDRSLRVDSWALCGDATASYVSVGDRLTITGNLDTGEFDATSITHSDGGAVC